jgi:hypothetical protein
MLSTAIPNTYMTTPTTTNSAATLSGKIISALANVGVQSVEALIIADVPALGFPVIKQIWEAAFGWVASYFVKAAQNGATFAVIDVQVGAEETAMSAALAAVVAAEKTGDAAKIKAAIQAYANAQSALVHDDGPLLGSGCATAIKDFQYCSPIPGGLGAACDNFLTANQQILDQATWLALQANWAAQGQATECTTSQVVGDLKAEIEKLCSVTKCSYVTAAKVQVIVSGLKKIQANGERSLTLK